MQQEDLYVVVKNHEEQYSIWPESKDVPLGWQVVGQPAARGACLAQIQELWTDMRPLSIRNHLDATTAGSKAGSRSGV